MWPGGLSPKLWLSSPRKPAHRAAPAGLGPSLSRGWGCENKREQKREKNINIKNPSPTF